MKNKVFVDTLFIVALINHRDQYHQKAVEVAQTFAHYYWITTDAVLLEIGNALASNHKSEALELIENFFTSDDVEVIRLNSDLFTAALNFYKNHQDKSWGLVDCVSFVVMKQQNVNQALTFDKHFVQAGFQAVMR